MVYIKKRKIITSLYATLASIGLMVGFGGNASAQSTGRHFSPVNRQQNTLMVKSDIKEFGGGPFDPKNIFIRFSDTKEVGISQIGGSTLVVWGQSHNTQPGDVGKPTYDFYESVESNGRWKVTDKNILHFDLQATTLPSVPSNWMPTHFFLRDNHIYLEYFYKDGLTRQSLMKAKQFPTGVKAGFVDLEVNANGKFSTHILMKGLSIDGIAEHLLTDGVIPTETTKGLGLLVLTKGGQWKSTSPSSSYELYLSNGSAPIRVNDSTGSIAKWVDYQTNITAPFVNLTHHVMFFGWTTSSTELNIQSGALVSDSNGMKLTGRDSMAPEYTGVGNNVVAAGVNSQPGSNSQLVLGEYNMSGQPVQHEISLPFTGEIDSVAASTAHEVTLWSINGNFLEQIKVAVP